MNIDFKYTLSVKATIFIELLPLPLDYLPRKECFKQIG